MINRHKDIESLERYVSNEIASHTLYDKVKPNVKLFKAELLLARLHHEEGNTLQARHWIRTATKEFEKTYSGEYFRIMKKAEEYAHTMDSRPSMDEEVNRFNKEAHRTKYKLELKKIELEKLCAILEPKLQVNADMFGAYRTA